MVGTIGQFPVICLAFVMNFLRSFLFIFLCSKKKNRQAKKKKKRKDSEANQSPRLRLRKDENPGERFESGIRILAKNTHLH